VRIGSRILAWLWGCWGGFSRLSFLFSQFGCEVFGWLRGVFGWFWVGRRGVVVGAGFGLALILLVTL